MVTSLLELDHSPATVTTLPTLFFGLSDEFGRLFVVDTILATVVLCIALKTNLGIAFRTLPVSPPVVELAEFLGSNKLVAEFSRTVDAVAASMFAVFLVPGFLEVVTKEALYMFKGNLVFGAAFGRHVLGIGDR